MLKSSNVNRETWLYFHSFIATWKVQELLLIAARGPLSLFSICSSAEKNKEKRKAEVFYRTQWYRRTGSKYSDNSTISKAAVSNDQNLIPGDKNIKKTLILSKHILHLLKKNLHFSMAVLISPCSKKCNVHCKCFEIFQQNTLCQAFVLQQLALLLLYLNYKKRQTEGNFSWEFLLGYKSIFYLILLTALSHLLLLSIAALYY